MAKKGLVLILAVLLMMLLAVAMAEGNTITLPNSLTVVEKAAFEGNTSMEAVTIPASVEEINSRAFADCTNLEAVTIESTNVRIAADAFDGSPVTFQVYQGTSAESYALAHGIPVTLLSNSGSFTDMALNLVMERGKPESGLMGEALASERLLVQMTGNSLPDISGYEPTRILSEGTGFFVIQFDSIPQASECYDFLKAREGQDVDFVEPDAFITVNYSSDDEVSAASLNEKWSDSDPMGLEVYSAYIQRKYPNASATVAVIDSGVAYHSAINNHILPGYDFTGQNNPRYDASNHGTSVAGTIVDAVYGANVSIIPIRIFGGTFQTTLMVRQAVQQAINCHPDVINISSVFDESAAVKSLLNRANCPVVVSAGNSGTEIGTLFPAYLDSVITVTSLDTNMTRAAHSNYGSSVNYCAPGTNIAGYTSSGGTYNDFAGTSYAAPQISAVIALISMDADPTHSVGNLKNISYDPTNPTITGKWSQYYGWGLPNLRMWCDRVVRINFTTEISSVMEVGSTSVLLYEMLPQSAEDKTVTITVSDPSVLNVSKPSDGILRIVGLSKGTANITITANDGSGVSVTSSDITVVQPVTKITIDAPTNTVNVAKAGETLGLSVLIVPTDASNKEVIWSSSDETIATVAQNGVVTPVSEGTVTIRADAADGFNAYGEFEVQVVSLITPETIRIVKSGSIVNVGETIQLGIEADPENAVKTVTWYCTNPDFATVSGGQVTGIAPGRVYIIATSTLDQTIQTSCELIIKQPPVELTLAAEEGATGILDAGKSLQLTAQVLPENADDTSVTWISSNTSVATVDETGKVYGISSGETIITVKSNGDNTLVKSYPVTVRLLPSEITIEGDDYVYPDTTKQLTAVVLPINADDISVTWSSSNPEVATVTNTGVVRGISEGVTVIEAKCNAVPELTATITMNIYPEWTYYDWVTEDLLPDDGIVTDRKWTYTETKSSTNNNLSGWNLVGSEMRQVGSGSVRWADFSPIGGFDRGHGLYSTYNKTAPTAYGDDNSATKRTVSTNPDGYIYWHWMYSTSANAYDRAIFYQSGYGSSSLTGNSYGYWNFGAFESYNAYPQVSAGSNWGQDDRYYLWYKVTDRSSNADTQGSWYWYRTQIYKTTYIDYAKYYNYSREMTVTTKPQLGEGISNIVAYVKYKVANSPGLQLSSWVPEANVPEGAEVVENRWSYKETITNNSPSMEGWTLENSEWRQSDSGSVCWADFAPISGFDHSNSLYTIYNKTAPSAYENTTAKRVINSTVNDGYIYWHWMYSVSANAYDRAIFYQNGYGSSTLTGNNYGYWYFGAFESYTAYPQMDAGTNWGQNDAYYLWYKVSDRTSNADSQGSWYWYRTQIKKTTYTDYIKQFTYSRNVTTTTEPAASETVSDITKLVRYIVKK